MSWWMHRLGLIMVRFVFPGALLLQGGLLLWYGVDLSRKAPGEAWSIILLSSAVAVGSLWLLWFLNRRGARERWELYSLPDEDVEDTGDVSSR